MVLTGALEHPVFDKLRTLARPDRPVYVIGGYVRDYILAQWAPERYPLTELPDIDIVTLGSGIALAEAFAKAVGADEVITYARFGTAMVRHEELQIEFVGARKESYNEQSRKPVVEDGSLEDDQRRRDFTINALSLSLNEGDYGALHDPFEGLTDLQNGVIRTPLEPALTFSDDPLRMLRAVRFAGRFGFELAPKTWEGLQAQAKRIDIISQERIAEELNKMLLTPKPSVAFKLLFKAGLLQRFFKELTDLQGVQRVGNMGHKDNFYHTLKVVDNLAERSDKLWLRWAALLHDIGKASTKRFVPGIGWTFHGHEERGARMVPKLFKRLRLPQNEKMRYVQKLVRLHQRPIALADEEVTDSAIRRIIVDAGEDLDDLLMLCRADITTRDKRKQAKYLKNFDYVEQRVAEVLERDQLRNWQPPVTGEMIMAHFGIGPGPLIGRIKTAVREAILEGEIPNDLEAAKAYMVKIGNELLEKP